MKKPRPTEAFEIPPHIRVGADGGHATRMRPTNERGEPIDAEPFPVRWDERLGAYVRA